MRKQYSPTLKSKVVLEALREVKPLTQIAAEYGIHPSLVTRWKADAVEGLPILFQRGTDTDEKLEASERKIGELYQEIGKLTTQLAWIKKKSGLNPESD